jgi:ATP-dependent DNA ligase
VLRFSEHLSAEHGEAMFRHACTMGLEGHHLEEAQPVQIGRVRSWLKVKNPAYEPRGVPWHESSRSASV